MGNLEFYRDFNIYKKVNEMTNSHLSEIIDCVDTTTVHILCAMGYCRIEGLKPKIMFFEDGKADCLYSITIDDFLTLVDNSKEDKINFETLKRFSKNEGVITR